MANFPPLRKPVREQRKPSHVVSFYSEIVDRNDSAYTANSPIKRGTLYSSITGADARVVAAYPNLYFLREQKVQLSDTLVSWLWTTDEEAENSYNAQISYLADATTNPAYARVSTIRRDAYEAAPTIATGTPLTALIGVKITAGGTGYTAPTATFGVAGTGAAVEFVLSGGVIISAIVTKEGTGFTSGSTITISDATGSGATAVCLVQPVAAVLTSQKKIELPEDDPMAHEFVQVARVYEVLPGPWIPFTRYQAFIGPIQGKQRAVLNTGQTAPPPTATLRINYEGRDGSSVVLMEKYETNSDGTGSAGNPAYPIFDTDYEDERGPVQKREQAIGPTGAEAGSLVNIAGVITQISYEPFPEYPGLLKQATETWAETGPVIPAPVSHDPMKGSVKSTSQLVPLSSPIQAGTLTSDGTTITRTTYEKFNKLQARKVIESWAQTGALLSGESKSMPRVTPAKFILSEQSAITSQLVPYGTAADAPTGEGDSSKVVPQSAVQSLKENETVTLETTDPVEYGMVQGQLETITVTHGSGSAPEIGFLTTDVSVVHEGGGMFVKKVGAVSEWLPLYSYNVDAQTGIGTLLANQYVPNDPELSVPNGIKGSRTVSAGASLVIVESKPYDEQKSLSTTTTITSADLPAPYSWTTTRDLSLPEELLDITTYYDTSSTTSSGTGHDLYSQNEDRWGGEVSTILRKLLGPFDCTITRSYHIGAPTIVATPTRFTLKSGTVVIKGGAKGSSWSSNSDGDIRTTESNSVSYRAIELPFSMCYDLSDSPSFGSNTASFTIVQPQSTPPIMPDTVIQVEVRELGIGGIFAMDVLDYAITT